MGWWHVDCCGAELTREIVGFDDSLATHLKFGGRYEDGNVRAAERQGRKTSPVWAHGRFLERRPMRTFKQNT
ncbi:MAG: hypothetical protein AMXMBFR47_24760 [Planctomycetota bacterium]